MNLQDDGSPSARAGVQALAKTMLHIIRNVGEGDKTNLIGYSMGVDELLLLSSMNRGTGIKYLFREDDSKLLKESAGDGTAARVRILRILSERGYISQNGTDSVTIDRIINGMIGICMDPELIVLLERWDEEGSVFARNFYISKKLVVEVERDAVLKNNLTLTPHKSLPLAISSMCEDIEPLEANAFSGRIPLEIRIGAENLKYLNGLDEEENRKQLLRALTSEGFEEKNAGAFLSGMVKRRNINTLSIFDNTAEERLLGSIVTVMAGKSIHHMILMPGDDTPSILLIGGGYGVLPERIAGIISKAGEKEYNREAENIE